LSTYTASEVRKMKDPLQRGWAWITIARTTDSDAAFIDALQGASAAADKCWRSDGALLMETVREIQVERGPSVVPAQLANTGRR
jgi:hypothetical protein